MIKSGACLSESPTKIRENTKDELKAKIIAAFSYLNKTVGKAWRRFLSRLEVVVEVNWDFFKWIQPIIFQDIFIWFGKYIR